MFHRRKKVIQVWNDTSKWWQNVHLKWSFTQKCLNPFCTSRPLTLDIILIPPGALDHTTEWIRSSIEEATQVMPPAEKSSDSGQSSKHLPGPTLVLNTAYIRLLTWDESKGPLPEVGAQTHSYLIELWYQIHNASLRAFLWSNILYFALTDFDYGWIEVAGDAALSSTVSKSRICSADSLQLNRRGRVRPARSCRAT